MRFLRRSLTGIFLLSVTLTLIAVAGNMVREALVARMNEEPRSFPQRERVLSVNVVTLAPQTLTPELTVFGELRSQRTLDLRSATGGTVLDASDLLVEGGAVTQGQLLLRIDPVEAEAALDRTRADLQDAQAELRDAERSLLLERDELAAAQAQADLRAQALTRARDLQTRGVGTAAAVEDAELAASSADASVLTRRQAVASAEARIDQARTRLARAEIGLSEAERDVDDTQVFAAFDGVLSDVTISPGGRVTANERFAQLVDPTQLEVSFRVSTSQYARLLDTGGRLLNAPVRVALDVSGVNLTATGTIIREGATVGEGQTGRLLFARLDAAPGFRPGDFVTVRIDEPELRNVAMVPATALAPDETVLVVGEDERLELGQVELLRRQGDDVIVRVGDLAGATIVAERSPLLGAGIRVRPIQLGGAAPQTADMITLDPERRAKLIAFVTEGRMPDDVKARIIGQLEQDEVSSETVARLESRMGSG
ncbi:HlyD family efflux transporter periplasmic adaptor subunit [Cognatiyoonia sp. IB215446]|uniref:efflux RND transporter periplasmic adaptor subunit n=1 Tax=Cognatiyoonia sp. IB215446 TaxID=3097355 RepID=UPI002A16780A|nr:HlyD family efflux transporter periplasmic adaptor subunit [Cognatiyoonia sp. IB215446]MDX8350064.1 HlyD family efflux transporter periplasmic adaptor subunit [Cognatiyoonia sp. IB215446]